MTEAQSIRWPGLFSAGSQRRKRVTPWLSLGRRTSNWAFINGTWNCFGCQIRQVRVGCQDCTGLVSLSSAFWMTWPLQEAGLVKEDGTSPCARYKPLQLSWLRHKDPDGVLVTKQKQKKTRSTSRAGVPHDWLPPETVSMATLTAFSRFDREELYSMDGSQIGSPDLHIKKKKQTNKLQTSVKFITITYLCP